MTQRKYREPTEDDIGKQIEVTDDRPTVKNAGWHNRTLEKIIPQSTWPFQTCEGSRWKYARIEATNDPA